MKKSYFITWVGALSSCMLALFGAKHCVKKYGEKLNNNKISVVKGADYLNKGMDLVNKLIK